MPPVVSLTILGKRRTPMPRLLPYFQTDNHPSFIPTNEFLAPTARTRMSSVSPFVETDDVRHLNVPGQGVPEGTAEFGIACLYSVIEYFANSYPDKGTRLGTKTVQMDTLRGMFISDEGGWRPKQDRLTQLSEMVTTVHFSTDKWPASAPTELSALIDEHISRCCPLIVFVDALQLRRDEDVRGPIYSVVVTGQDHGEAAIMDPWGGYKKTVTYQKLDTAWDEELHQVIKIRCETGPISPEEIE